MQFKTMKQGFRALVIGVLATSMIAIAPTAYARKRTNSCADCGTVLTTNRKDEKGSGTAGTVVGGVGGAVAGNVIGHNTTSTVLGGVGGAVAGNLIGKKLTRKKIWSVQVKMDNGSIQDVDFTSDPNFRQGERVRVRDGTLS
ncbi:MAG: glycine zipper 2TM domain-containing protein, partial [Burkholderiaceae bacterium]